MTVQELICELSKFPATMEVVDYTGDAFDELHYKRVYDSQYPHKEVEHLAVCIDFACNYIPLNFGELKDILKCQIYDYPEMYQGDDKVIVDTILNYPQSKDNETITLEPKWEYYCQNEYDKAVYKFKGFNE